MSKVTVFPGDGFWEIMFDHEGYGILFFPKSVESDDPNEDPVLQQALLMLGEIEE